MVGGTCSGVRDEVRNGFAGVSGHCLGQTLKWWCGSWRLLWVALDRRVGECLAVRGLRLGGMRSAPKEFEGCAVPGCHGEEVAVIEAGDLSDVQAFGDGDDMGIGDAERESRILLDQFDCPVEVGRGRGDDAQLAVLERLEQLDLRTGDVVAGLDEDRRGHQQRWWRPTHESRAGLVVPVSAVEAA